MTIPLPKEDPLPQGSWISNGMVRGREFRFNPQSNQKLIWKFTIKTGSLLPIWNLGGKEKETERQRRNEKERRIERERERERDQRNCSLHFLIIVSVCLKYNYPTLFIGSYPTTMKSNLRSLTNYLTIFSYLYLYLHNMFFFFFPWFFYSFVSLMRLLSCSFLFLLSNKIFFLHSMIKNKGFMLCYLCMH